MPTLHLVRHGHAAAGWGEDADPGLDARGHQQAHAVAVALGGLAPRRLVSSPLRRATETAAPLAAAWGRPVAIDPAFGEIPSPTPDLAQRQAWLSSALGSHWADLGDDIASWRQTLLAAARAIDQDTIVFTHFVAINAVVAEATADAAVTVFLPANTSVTEITVDHDTGRLRLAVLGSEATPELG